MRLLCCLTVGFFAPRGSQCGNQQRWRKYGQGRLVSLVRVDSRLVSILHFPFSPAFRQRIEKKVLDSQPFVMTACDLLILHGSVKDPCPYPGAVFSGICHSVIKMYSSTISKTIEFSVKSGSKQELMQLYFCWIHSYFLSLIFVLQYLEKS